MKFFVLPDDTKLDCVESSTPSVRNKMAPVHPLECPSTPLPIEELIISNVLLNADEKLVPPPSMSPLT